MPITIGILTVISALTCFTFIFRGLQINHVIKKMLLFATAQQAIGYGIFVVSVVLFVYGLKNILTCFLAVTSLLASAIGTQTSVSAISITRYSFTECISHLLQIELVHSSWTSNIAFLLNWADLDFGLIRQNIFNKKASSHYQGCPISLKSGKLWLNSYDNLKLIL